ncbi:hypothetical protein K1718_09600 [Roseibium porphyridii]|uniref:Uncharacterized protein n=1 Tax=Roseibium porphyridii TaxID=2866279 RepID=A0ABY8FBN1_9HYPH|nr:hypothetical protein [Roseibium sp. KMA01]WFE91592.1 hypothetical protein K1718_09600 [Roseibium sp. KMA01]
MLTQPITNFVAKRIGSALGKAPFNTTVNHHEPFIEKISEEFEIDYYDAMELYFDNEDHWEDYYAGKRVSGFHPSWERTFGKTEPPVFTPEQRDFLKQRDSVTTEKRNVRTKQSSDKRTNPFELDTQDLRLQAALLERTPILAEQLIVSAGRDPRLFGL